MSDLGGEASPAGLDLPALAVLVPVGGEHLVLEAQVRLETMAAHDLLDVGLDLGLAGEGLAPARVLLVGKRVQDAGMSQRSRDSCCRARCRRGSARSRPRSPPARRSCSAIAMPRPESPAPTMAISVSVEHQSSMPLRIARRRRRRSARSSRIAAPLERDHHQLPQAADDDDRRVHGQRAGADLGLHRPAGVDQADQHRGEALERGQSALGPGLPEPGSSRTKLAYSAGCSVTLSM